MPVIFYKHNPECVSTMNPYGIDLRASYTSIPNTPYPASLWSDVFRENLAMSDLPDDWEETLHYIFEQLAEDQMSAYTNIEAKAKAAYATSAMSCFEQRLIPQCEKVKNRKAAQHARSYMRREFFLYMQYGMKEAERMKAAKEGLWSTLDRPACELRFSSLTRKYLRTKNIVTIQQLIEHLATIPKSVNRKIPKEIEEKLATLEGGNSVG